MNSARQDSMSEAEIQNLLDAWVLVRSKVWNASYGVMAASAPAGWKQFLELSARPYEQMVEGVLRVQAAGVSTALHALEQVTAMQQQLVAPWGEAMRRFVDAAEVQRPTAEAQSAALAEQGRHGNLPNSNVKAILKRMNGGQPAQCARDAKAEQRRELLKVSRPPVRDRRRTDLLSDPPVAGRSALH